MTYKEKLLDPRWQRKRLEILNRDDWTCKYCGDKDSTLHVHHSSYAAKNPWDEKGQNLKTACAKCHSLLHDQQLIIGYKECILKLLETDGYVLLIRNGLVEMLNKTNHDERI